MVVGKLCRKTFKILTAENLKKKTCKSDHTFFDILQDVWGGGSGVSNFRTRLETAGGIGLGGH